MVMVSGRLHTRHLYSVSTRVGWFDCGVLLSSTHKIIFFCSNKNTSKFSMRLQSSGRLDLKWACREVFVPSELLGLAHFISVLTNMRHKEKILRSSNFLLPRETQIVFLLSDKIWQNQLCQNQLTVLTWSVLTKDGCLACRCGPASVRVSPRVHAA